MPRTLSFNKCQCINHFVADKLPAYLRKDTAIQSSCLAFKKIQVFSESLRFFLLSRGTYKRTFPFQSVGEECL